MNLTIRLSRITDLSDGDVSMFASQCESNMDGTISTSRILNKSRERGTSIVVLDVVELAQQIANRRVLDEQKLTQNYLSNK